MGSVTAQLQLLLQLEGQLRKLSKEKSFWDPAVREVRKQLRSTAEAIVLQNFAAAEEKGLEVKLWHVCFHKPVQEFRRRIAEAEAKGDKGKEALSKLKRYFEALLAEAVAFYKTLAMKLQLVYGDVGYKLSTRDAGLLFQHLQGTKAAEHQLDVRASVHRCLVCVGDLTRYQIQISVEERKDWSKADEFYQEAISVYPEGGNAYNQRAVLAGYESRELEAVYNYFRSLGVASPFTIAKENLNQLFEQVRQRQKKLPRPAVARGSMKACHAWKLPDLMRIVETRFLHLHGLLFTGIDLDTFTVAIQAALSNLDDLLARDAVVKGPPGHGPQSSDMALLQLAALAIFHPNNLPSGSRGPELARRAAVREAALDLIFVLTGRLARALSLGGSSAEMGIATSPMLPALCILLQWLATHPEELRDEEKNGARTRSYMCKGLAELTVAAAASCEANNIAQDDSLAASSKVQSRALPEDVELQAYLPLLRAQEAVDYEHPLTSRESTIQRLKRITDLLRGIADGMRSAHLSEKAGCPAACKAVATFLGKTAQNLHSSGPSVPQEPPPTDVELDDEEVIVFNPSAARNDASLPAELEPIASGPVAELKAARRAAEGVLASPSETMDDKPTPMIVSPQQQPPTETILEPANRQPADAAIKGAALFSLQRDSAAVAEPMLAELPSEQHHNGQNQDIQGPSELQSQLGRGSVEARVEEAPAAMSNTPAAISEQPAQPMALGHADMADMQDVVLPLVSSTGRGWEPLTGRMTVPAPTAPPASEDLQDALLKAVHRADASKLPMDHVSSDATAAAVPDFQQLSQAQFSRPPTRPGSPRNMLTARDAVGAPPGFPQPGSYGGSRSSSRMDGAQQWDAGSGDPALPTPSTATTLLEAQLAGYLPSIPPANALHLQSGPWAGLEQNSLFNALPRDYQGAGHAVEPGVAGPLPGQQQRASEPYAGFYPQSPLPSHLPTHLFSSTPLDLVAQHSSHNANPAYGTFNQGLPSQISAGVNRLPTRDIWQGLGMAPSREAAFPAAEMFSLTQGQAWDTSGHPNLIQPLPSTYPNGLGAQHHQHHTSTDCSHLQELLAGGSAIPSCGPEQLNSLNSQAPQTSLFQQQPGNLQDLMRLLNASAGQVSMPQQNGLPERPHLGSLQDLAGLAHSSSGGQQYGGQASSRAADQVFNAANHMAPFSIMGVTPTSGRTGFEQQSAPPERPGPGPQMAQARGPGQFQPNGSNQQIPPWLIPSKPTQLNSSWAGRELADNGHHLPDHSGMGGVADDTSWLDAFEAQQRRLAMASDESGGQNVG